MHKIGLAHIKNNKLLLCRPFAFDSLILPGGLKKSGESSVENLVRQVTEELGKDAHLETDSLCYLGNFSDLAAGRTERTVEIELYSGGVSGTLVASTEIKELEWFSPTDDWETLSPIIKNKILPFLIQKRLLE